jgi:hypothetical protein
MRDCRSATGLWVATRSSLAAALARSQAVVQVVGATSGWAIADRAGVD